jgi:glycosyltransferase involved in cell wall biosynthesis
MRVLWFTNIELPAVARRLSGEARLTGGWMESLRAALREQGGPGSGELERGGLELGVAAAGSVPYEPFDEDSVRYFHIQRPPAGTGIRAVARQWQHTPSDAPALVQARAAVESFRPDLIHVHGSEGPMGLLAGTVDSPVLVSLQGILTVCERFFYAGLPPSEVARDAFSLRFLKGQGMIHAHWNMEAAARRESRILERCHYFAGRTDWDRSVLRAINPAARYYHAGEIVRPEFYAAAWAPDRRPEVPFRIYSTGGPAPYRGIVNLLEAVALLRAGGRSPGGPPGRGPVGAPGRDLGGDLGGAAGPARRPMVLRIGGEVMSTGMRPIIARAMRSLRMDDVVTWLGPLGPAELVAELEAADVYVHPSLVDNSPNALAEAQVVGVPCVASAVGGIPSLITHGVDGLLAAPNDVYDLAGKIAAVEADPELAGRLAEGAGRNARRRHDPHTIAGETMEMYADIIDRYRAGER